MRRYLLSILFLLALKPLSQAQCFNTDFEGMAAGQYTAGNSIPGWSLTNCSNNSLACNLPPYYSGSQTFWLRQTPFAISQSSVLGAGLLPINFLGHSPLGGTVVAQLNNFYANYNWEVTRLSKTINVTSANSLFEYAFAGYWDINDGCCNGADFRVEVYDCAAQQYTCAGRKVNSLCNITAPTLSITGFAGQMWTDWQVGYIDLSPYVGSCVTIHVLTKDCAFGSHIGSAYFDARCRSQNIGVDYCSSSAQALLKGPLGYAIYSWVAPAGSASLSASEASQPTLSVSNPVPGSIYTLNLTSYMGCQLSSTYAIVPSVVSINNTYTQSSCYGGASGSATVVASGSGSGYNYTWTNLSTNSVISTGSVASNLAPGTYSVFVSAAASSSCGTSSTTVAISASEQPVKVVSKHFCTDAYLSVVSLGNTQWYNSLLAPIAASLGGTQSSYTVSNGCSNCFVYAAYLSSQGCRDSVAFHLFPNTNNAANMFLNSNFYSCLGGSNGTVEVNFSPTPNPVVPWFYSVSITPTGTTSSTYTANLSSTTSNSLLASGLPPGSYSVVGSDGACVYSNSFSINPLSFDYTISPASNSVCLGSFVYSLLNHNPAPLGYYSYSWTPSTHIFGSTTGSNVVFQPTTTSGSQSSIVYTAVVTPSIHNCPLAKEFTLTVLNPGTPTLAGIPNLCSADPLFTISATPSGGLFSSSSGNAIDALSGIINPALATPGLNTFSYTASVYTCAPQTATASYFVVQTIGANLNLPSLPLVCESSAPIDLMPIAQNQVGNWTMTAVPGVSVSPLQNNFFSPAGLASGTYVVTYTTNSVPPGCTDSETLSIPVLNPPSPSIQPLPLLCNNQAPVQVLVNPPGGSWQGGAYLNNNGEFLPSLATIGTNTIGYSVGTGTCSKTSQITVNVEKFISADFVAQPGPYCLETAAVDLTNFVANPGGSWSGSGLSGSLFLPSTAGVGKQILQYTTHSLPTASLCPDSKTLSVEVLANPVSFFSPPPKVACTPTQVVFNSNNSSGNSTWLLEPGSISLQGANVSHYFDKAGTFSITLYYSDEAGCKANPVSQQFVIFETPKAVFTLPSEAFLFEQPLPVINLSTRPDITSFQWFLNQEAFSLLEAPLFDFTEPGTYTVSLLASSNTCSDTSTREILIKGDQSVFIPNSFSPNGDRLNDEFKPVFSRGGLLPGSYRLEIYDRWGHEIYSTNEVEPGWNGAFQNKGEVLPKGVYTYVIRYTDMDGKPHRHLGSVSILH